ncbi:hypothetical protein HPP92_011735 [Vanilla planifolia]|uniref:Uncharacterized protein n=1 Tax=Vanilla planifolia TaxID=51239 RepID=A0A835V0G5_VANPL|nr:hypothetical protein HPP92_011735 [Vanilla planifolia]
MKLKATGTLRLQPSDGHARPPLPRHRGHRSRRVWLAHRGLPDAAATHGAVPVPPPAGLVQAGSRTPACPPTPGIVSTRLFPTLVPSTTTWAGLGRWMRAAELLWSKAAGSSRLQNGYVLPMSNGHGSSACFGVDQEGLMGAI